MARKRQQVAESQETEAPESAPATAAEPAAQTPTAAAEAPAAQAEPDKPQRQFGGRRSWVEQYSGPLQYEMFTVGKTIMFRFKLPKGQDKPADEALEIMRSHKQTPEGQPTGLKFGDTRMHGKIWTIPNDPEGRELAQKIEMELAKVARKLEPTPALPD
jgi:hypothetical protein